MLSAIGLAILVAHVAAAAPALAGQQPVTSTEQSSAEKPWPPPGVFRSGGNVTAPRLIKSARPNYSGDAMRAKIQGRVFMEAVVLPDGTVGEVRVKRSLDRKYGLDDAAVASLKEYRFTPGTKDGVAVPVLLSFEVDFSIRK
jgi:protein TonB